VHISPLAKLPQLSDNISVFSIAESTSSYQQTEHGGRENSGEQQNNSDRVAVILPLWWPKGEDYRR